MSTILQSVQSPIVYGTDKPHNMLLRWFGLCYLSRIVRVFNNLKKVLLNFIIYDIVRLTGLLNQVCML